MGYVIAVDAMGGDHAPGAVVEGVKRALAAYEDVSVQLYGPQDKLAGLEGVERLTVCHAPQVVDIHEPPMLAVRKKTDSSLVQAMLAVRERMGTLAPPPVSGVRRFYRCAAGRRRIAYRPYPGHRAPCPHRGDAWAQKALFAAGLRR